MIRNATTEDLPRLLELGEAMHAESRYSIMSFDREKVAGLLTTLMTTDTGFLMVAETDGRIIGGFAGIVSEHWFSHDKLASDIALFIEQEFRRQAKRGGDSGYLFRRRARWVPILKFPDVALAGAGHLAQLFEG